ncbi:Ig-like domain-containing protein [Arthrobacter koreensis]|uniref:Ig-like domain-containing protein n=1 Tax=Arthrobacter koreensis TaxID=199136 RepID=UPI002DBF9BE7|nr:Ig-like domain-containing protein [Arthrobacter koreensis]MEB7447765.1 Ig-like domain-containing protein [Arthrobacter koreensis]
MPARLRAHRKAISAGAAVAAAGALVATAILYPGFARADVDLNDGGVWVTNQTQGMVGHLNYPSRMLDGAYAANSDRFNVTQHESTVFHSNTDQSKISPVDVANVARGTEVQLPASAVLSQGGNAVAVTDPAAGNVWLTSTGSLPFFSDTELEPAVQNAPGAAADVSPEGAAVIADPRGGRIYSYQVAADGSYGEPSVTEAEELKGFGDVQVAAVGTRPVAFDAESGTLVLPGGRTVEFDDTRGAQLQDSGPESDVVALATATALIEQPLNGSEATVTEIEGSGTPAPPVMVDGCVHAAWAGAGTYVRNCEQEADNLREEIPGIGASSDLVFRVNRSVVVLNDVNGGNVWLVLENMQLVDNWGDVIPPKQDSSDDEEESASENPVNTLPDRTGENRPPVASDDRFGVRAGRTTILNVLDNDTDPDGDLLTVRLTGEQPAAGVVQEIYNGAGLQIVVPADASGTSTFTYEVSDGRGGTASATATVQVRGAGENAPPEPRRSTRILVEQGKSVSQNILNDWMDPDGDDLVLLAAEPTADGDQVRTRSDGLLTFRDIGKTQGVKDVAVTISDGTETATGTITFDVRPAGVLPPVTNFDHFTATVGEAVTLYPLQNDLDPAGGQLSLARVEQEQEDGSALVPNYETGAVSFTPAAASTYYLEYLVTNGPQSAAGLIRVDAQESGRQGAPVAVRDVALLPRGGSVLVDVLGNDTDPTGGVLVVQSVSTGASSPLDVEVLDHNILQIHDVRGMQEQGVIRYTVSNGSASASGEVSVLPVEPPETLLPPAASADTATVRVGDVVDIPVLENDTSPTGDELTLNPVLPQDVDPADGQLFVSENILRFVAGDTAKTVYAIYEVRDSSGQSDSAQVRINILPRDDEKNTPPVPRNLEGRAIAGTTVRIPVPLNGLDADGDSVYLDGIAAAPALGAAVPGPDYIDYTASASGRGTDSFTYTVRDRLGLVNSGTVRVGIAPAAEANQKPVAVNDAVTVRPGREVAVPVLANDSDPDGDPISLDPDGVSAQEPSMDARADGPRVRFTVPDEPGTYNIRYAVKDNRGGSANGNVAVVSDPNAELLAPIARDDRVEVAEIRGRTAVDVAVLENDEDPDGVAEDLEVSVDPLRTTASVVADKVRVQLTEEAQAIPYTVQDMDGGTATAVVWVPGLSAQYPTLRSSAVQEVQAGDTLDLELGDLVEVREGRTPRITETAKVSAIGSSNRDTWVADEDTLAYTADEDYAGLGAMTFEVTDGSGPDDPEGLKATLTVLINVIPLPEQNLPPVMNPGSLEAAKGEDSVRLDLAPLASDPNPEDADRLEFALAGPVPDGFEASLSGTILEVAAADSAAVGTVGQLAVTVTDGRSDPVPGRVDLTVLASTRPLPVAADDSVDDAVQGKPVTVDVLANDDNPFPETPLRILEATADGNGTAQISGDSIVVTPNPDFVGSMSVQYRVEDKTRQADRQASAQIRLSVQGRPDSPSTPVVESTRSRTVVLSWDPPASNGSPITGYTVTGSNGFSQDCPATTCTLAGLTNNVEYTFAVTATNANGTSDPSPQSAAARPDTQPAQPAPPVLAFGDRQLDISWSAPANDGSPIESYDLQISPAPPGGTAQKTVPASMTRTTWTGLANGTSYRVRVQARNAAPEPSGFSEYSSPEVPAGVPSAPGTPTTAKANSVGVQSQLTVDWADSDPNGADVTAYELREYRGSTLVRTLEAGAASNMTVRVDNSEQNYSYSARAYNKAGWSEWGPTSAPRRAVGVPDAPAAPVLAASRTGAEGRAVTITFTPLAQGARNGARAEEISYRASFSDGRSMMVSSGQEITGFSNGATITARLTAVVNSDGSSYDSAASAASAGVKVFGSPGTPSASGSDGGRGSRTARLSWAPPNQNAHDVAQVQISVNGGGWENVGVSGSRDVGDGYNQTVSIRVRVLNSQGTAGGIAEASARTGSEPPPATWTLTVGNQLSSGDRRTCMDPVNGTNYTSDGRCLNNHWAYIGDSIETRCYIVRRSGEIWYRQLSGPNASNNGLHIKGIHTNFGYNPPGGMGQC